MLQPRRLVAVTFLLELGVDLALEPGLAFPSTGARILGYPRTRIYLVARESRGLQIEQTLACFRPFFDGVNITLDPQVDWSFTLSGTSAAVTILHPTRANHFCATEEWITRRFEEALGALDHVLSCVGFLADLPDIGALRRGDLPANVLVAINDQVQPPGFDVFLTPFRIHSFEEWRSVLVGNDELFEAAAWLSQYLNGRGRPARLFVEYTQRAARDLMDGRPDQAVVSATTAIETLGAAVITELSHRKGASAKEIATSLNKGLRKLLVEEVRPYLESAGGVPTAVDDWLSDCYAYRNRVVHEGGAPSHRAADAAITATRTLAVTIAETLRRDPGTRWLGEAIPLRLPTSMEVGAAYITDLLAGTQRD